MCSYNTLRDCREIEVDYVFRERVPYDGTAPERKAESANAARLCGIFIVCLD